MIWADELSGEWSIIDPQQFVETMDGEADL